MKKQIRAAISGDNPFDFLSVYICVHPCPLPPYSSVRHVPITVCMERRREPRLKPEQPVRVTILDESGQHLDAVVHDVSGRGLGLMTSRPVEAGKALKIQLENAMLLAEAVYCQAAGSGFYVGVELDQILDGLASLARSLEEFSPEKPTPVDDPVRIRE